MNIVMIFAWLLKNTMTLLIFAAMAVRFDKWWIILFALCFMSNLKRDYKTYRVCDKCGKHSPYADSYNEALVKAKDAGWIHITDGNRDYCLECKDKI